MTPPHRTPRPTPNATPSPELAPTEVTPIDLAPTEIDPPGERPGVTPAARGDPHAGVRALLADATSARPGSGSASGEHELEPGATIGAYRIERELARGGQGRVYVAADPALERRVAIKVLLRGSLSDGHALERFQTEARAAARLRHAGIVGVHEVGVDAGRPFLVMDLIEGESLDVRLTRDGPLAPRDAARLTLALADALAYAHERSILHRDLKPANVLIGADGQPVLTDFGLAKEIGRTGITIAGQVMGTPAYMPPEQAGGELDRIDRRSDLYSLGATLFEMLTGRPPYTGSTPMEVITAVLHRDPPPPGALRPGLDRDIETVCSKCLEREPEHRYGSARELATDLERYLRDEPVLARPPSIARRAAKWARRNRGISAAGAAAAIVLLIAFVLVPEARHRAAVGEARIAVAAIDELERTARAQAEATLATIPIDPEDRRAPTPEERARHAERIRELQRVADAHGALLDLEPDDDAARRRRYGALVLLGRLAAVSENDALAELALGQAAQLERAPGELGPAAALRDDVAGARGARLRVHRRRIEEILAAGEAGELGRWNGEAYVRAKVELVRYDEPQTVELLADHLDGTSAALREARASALRGAGLPDPRDEGASAPIEPLDAAVEALGALPPGRLEGHLDPTHRRAIAAARTRLEARHRHGLAMASRDTRLSWRPLLAAAQRSAVSRPRLTTAQLACEVLGLLRQREGAVAALRRHVWAQEDETLAAFAARALCSIEGLDADDLRFLGAAVHRFGTESHFEALLRRELRRIDGSIAVPDDDAGALRLRASIRRARGDHEGGRADLDRAIDLEPDVADHRAARALARRETGDLDGALEDIERALDLAPDSPRVLADRGGIRHARGDHAGALADYDRSIELAPDEPSSRTNRGYLRSEEGDRTGAIEDYDAALDIDPDFVPALLNRGVLRQTGGDLDGATRDAERALQLDPENARALRQLGDASRLAGQPGPAIAYYDRALALSTDDRDTLRSRALARVDAGDLDGALRDLDAILAAEPDFVAALVERGRVRRGRREADRALADFERAIALAPRNPWALLNRGVIRQDRGEIDGAIADYDLALAIDPTIVRAWTNRGVAHLAKGDLDRALADADEAIRLDGSIAEAHVLKGDVHYKRRELADAFAAYDAGRKVAPRNASAWCGCGFVLRHQGKRKEALAAFDRALELDPWFVDARIVRGEVRLRSGDVDGAIADFDEVIRTEPHRWEPWSNRGHALRMLKRLDEAKRDFEQAVKLAPHSAPAWMNAGIIREQLGDIAGAIEAWKKAIEADPKWNRAKLEQWIEAAEAARDG